MITRRMQATVQLADHRWKTWAGCRRPNRPRRGPIRGRRRGHGTAAEQQRSTASVQSNEAESRPSDLGDRRRQESCA